MSAKAVVVLAALARDEFERAWNGYEEPFSFIDGQLSDTDDPVEDLTAVIDGKTFRLPARQTAEVLLHQLADFRDEVENETCEDDGPSSGRWFDVPTEEEMDERAWERLEARWTDQLEYEVEHLAVFEARLHWLVEAWKAMVANFVMVGERMPELKPVLAEKLQEAYERLVQSLGTVKAS